MKDFLCQQHRPTATEVSRDALAPGLFSVQVRVLTQPGSPRSRLVGLVDMKNPSRRCPDEGSTVSRKRVELGSRVFSSNEFRDTDGSLGSQHREGKLQVAQVAQSPTAAQQGLTR